MKLTLGPITRLLPASVKVNGRDGLLFQRLFWGAMAGCLATLMLAESPVLESMEMSMLQWRYRVSNKIATLLSKPVTSDDITLVSFDDSSQFDLKDSPRFNNNYNQELLASTLAVIEKGKPAMVVIDLDLRGAADPILLETIKRLKNVIVAVFLDGNSELSEAFSKNAKDNGYDELDKETNGVVCRLPITYRGVESGYNTPFSSLTEAVAERHRSLKGVGPPIEYFASRADQPLYLGYKRIDYPTVSFHDISQPGFQPSQFKDRIVLIGSALTPPGRVLQSKNMFDESVPDFKLHADSISTVLNNEVIYSFPKDIAHHILLLLGAAFGALASILPMSLRTAAYLCSSMFLVAIAQLVFQVFDYDIPVASPLAVLTLGFSLGTFIYLDTDLRLRNRELAQARESMQVRAEEERQRIAEDLHDETLPALSSVARMADKLAQELSDNPVPNLMRTKLDHAVAEMRRVINDLHPSVLETMGFKPALENLVDILSHDTGIASKFEDGDGRSDYAMPDFKKLQLYRIVQEGLNNVQKHSGASTVELNIREHDGYIYITLADNGKGINLKAIRRDSHGLLNIRQRAQLIGAQVEWKKPEKFPTGTEMRLKIPFIEMATGES